MTTNLDQISENTTVSQCNLKLNVDIKSLSNYQAFHSIKLKKKKRQIHSNYITTVQILSVQ